jgi:small nuclear ribonucleoprotein G
MPQAQPELKKARHFRVDRLEDSLISRQYMEKRLFVQLNGNRKVIGILRGYDVCSIRYWSLIGDTDALPQVFLNVVLDEAVEEKASGERVRLGMVVSWQHHLADRRLHANEKGR